MWGHATCPLPDLPRGHSEAAVQRQKQGTDAETRRRHHAGFPGSACTRVCMLAFSSTLFYCICGSVYLPA